MPAPEPLPAGTLVLLAAEFDPERWPTALAQVHQVYPFSYILADWWDGPGLFAHYPPNLSTVFHDPTTGGRTASDCLGGGAFGPDLDISWRRVGARLRAALVAEVTDPDPLRRALLRDGSPWKVAITPAGGAEAERWVRPAGSEDEAYFLWGSESIAQDDQHQTSTWVEARIPRPLVYPVIPSPCAAEDGSDKNFSAVRLHVRPYYDVGGRPIIYRRLGLSAQVQSRDELGPMARGAADAGRVHAAPSQAEVAGDA